MSLWDKVGDAFERRGLPRERAEELRQRVTPPPPPEPEPVGSVVADQEEPEDAS